MIPAIISKKADLDVILLSYNFSMEPSLDPLIDSAEKAGLGIVAMKVMAGGFRRVKAGDKLHDTLQREGAMLAALKWVLKNPNVHTTIPSITDMDQLDENMKAMTADFSDKRQANPGWSAGLHPPALLPKLRPVQRRLSQRPARLGHSPISELRRRLRAVPAGARRVSSVAPEGPGHTLHALSGMHDRVPERCPGT